ncbi:DsbA family protein [Desulfatitalea alkaliphila]|uniref:Thioredoxin domain-containing protein n=1 Tax=Desulfatitalea alkaliphila TaxID=2929485 RepID=A0AA41R5Q7_9BACT|nr:thioredoxin domain-containing protein [Desulfatitalea alkaliphila]MCJ8501341.1 thioredoxin domain-containing protein [Desulfatitalea alkaliphila]
MRLEPNKNRRFGFSPIRFMAGLLLLGAFVWAAPALAAEEQQAPEPFDAVFTFGDGPIELFVFADYFCPPCRRVEPHLDKALRDLVPLGVQVTFVDMPFSRMAPLYARYFLYAAKAASSLDGVLHARDVLFQIAKNNGVASDQEMVKALKENEVAITYFDVRPLLTRWGEIIQAHNVRSTPTCIIVKPGQEPSRHVGSEEIPKAIDQLLAELSGNGKTAAAAAGD